MDYQVYFKYPAVLLTACCTTLLLTPFIRNWARARGLMDVPDSRRLHSQPVPRLGGLAVFLGFHLAAAVVFFVPWLGFFGSLTRIWWFKFLAVSTLITALGVVDDVRSIRPQTKLLGQIAVAVLAFLFDMRFGIILGVSLPWALDLTMTALWILIITNAFNLIDGMDGLAVGLALIASLGMAGGLLIRHMPGDVLILLGLAGACAGFLRYNFHPATIFLGDSGSMFLGFTLAVIALSSGSKGTAMASIAVPVLAVGVPLFDTILAVWRRSVRGFLATPGNDRSGIMQADMDHLHHRLSRTGLSQRRVATILYVLGTFLVCVALLGLLYQAYAMGIYLMAFVAGVYVIVKHLARVELWDSGTALLYGLRRPPGKVAAMIFYPVLDALVLAGCLLIALWCTGDEYNAVFLKRAWVRALPFWAGISFIVLFLTRAYQRVWSRACAVELLQLAAALLLGVLMSLAFNILNGMPLNRDLVMLTLTYFGLSLLLIVGLRVLPRLLQDVMVFCVRHPSLLLSRNYHNVLLYGAGTHAILFLRHRSAKCPRLNDRRRIIGFVDDDLNLRGRLVYGYPVRGDSSRLEELMLRYKIKELILTITLPPPMLQAVQEKARRKNVRITEWRMEERSMEELKEE